MTRPIRIGLAGCGAMGRDVHLPLLQRVRDFTVVAVADPDPAAREAATRLAPGATACATHEELLARSDIQAVIIATPTPSHAAVARIAFERRVHVYLEKPLAGNLEEAADVMAAWQAAGTVGMIGFNYRFNPLFAAAKRHVNSDALGSVVSVRSVFTTPSHAGTPLWRAAGEPGGGALLDLGSHHLDLLPFLFGAPCADLVRVDMAGRDGVAIQGRVGAGILFQSMFAAGTVDEDRLDIYGDRGSLSIDRYRSLDATPEPAVRRSRVHTLTSPGGQLARLAYLGAKLRSPRGEPSHALALQHFAGAVRGEHPASPDLFDGWRSLQAVFSAVPSTKEECRQG